MSSPTRLPDSATPEVAGRGEDGTGSRKAGRLSGDSLLHALLELQTDFLQGGDRQRSLERWLTLLLEEVGGELGRAEASESLQLLLSVGDSLLRGWRDTPQAQAPRARPSLQEELEQLRQTLGSIEEDLWFWNPTTQELHTSHRWRESLGYAESEVEPTFDGWKRLCHPEDISDTEHSLRELAAGVTPHSEVEYRARSKHGEWAWFRSRARVAARDEHGRAIRVVGTDRHEAERGAPERPAPGHSGSHLPPARRWDVHRLQL